MVLWLDFIPGFDLFEVVLFLVEFSPYLLAVNLVLVMMVKKQFRTLVLCFLPLFVITTVAIVVITSYEHAMKNGFDLSKPSIREALENYIATGEGDLEEIIDSKNYPPVFGQYEMNYLLTDLLKHTFFHFDAHNEENIPVSYNKGNDWFRATLGEPMIYTSAVFEKGNESLWEAQKYKLDYVAQAINLQKGDQVLDIGCGWGTLVEHFSVKYGADVLGVTLSSEQVKFFDDNKRKKLPKPSKSKIMLQDAMKMMENDEMKGRKFDSIVSLEMMEHVGIRRYQQFLHIVKTLLKDDGVFYMQVAGLRRDWRFDDFIWGLFMGEHIFPGADASCPLGWITTQLERAGFEVQRVNNLGTHYRKTLIFWLEEWRATKDDIVKKYGIKAYRRWEVFLRWAITVAREGSSTVFMITTTKHNQVQPRLDTQKRLAPVWN